MNRYAVLSTIAVLTLLFASTYFVDNSKTHTLITKDQAELYNAFVYWIQKHTKNYREEEQKAYRFLKFKINYEFVQQHNARYALGLQTYTVGLNQFADMDNIQFSSIYLKKKKSADVTKECKTKLPISTDIPESWDWASKAVAPVRNQGNCGSCWAFSACGALEGLNAINSGKISVFSTQQLVDCSTKKEYGNEGCNGGEMDAAFWYVIDHGIALQSKYPYTGRDGKCNYTSAMNAFQIKDCAQVAANKSIALKSAVYTQPVSISVEADTLGFQLYNHGVFSGKCGTDLDHGIVLTGYGNLDGKAFWKCKNSWGGNWGVGGYIMIARGDDKAADEPGQCGILMENSVPLL